MDGLLKIFILSVLLWVGYNIVYSLIKDHITFLKRRKLDELLQQNPYDRAAEFKAQLYIRNQFIELLLAILVAFVIYLIWITN